MITVIIPTRNRPHQLKDLLISILGHNTYNDFEILIIDDCSNDENKKILENILADKLFFNFKLRYIYSIKQKYPAGCRNIAALEARGEILYFVDDDCEFRHDNLREISKFYAEHINEKFILGGYNICPGKNLLAALYNNFFNCSLWLSCSIREGLLRKIFIWGERDNFFVNFVPSLNMACKRNIFDSLRFNEEYKVNEDEIFCNEAIKSKYTILFTKKLKLAHNHAFRSFSELLLRLTELGRYYRRKNIFRRIIFVFLYPWAMVLFTRNLPFVFHYATMSYAWARPFLVKESERL